MLSYRSGARSTEQCTVEQSIRLGLTSPVPAAAHVAEPRPAHLVPLTMPAGWQAGTMHAQVMADPAATVVRKTQGGRISRMLGCDVTDNKFFPRMGPPSCSPPA